jgi:hypothetical protein
MSIFDEIPNEALVNDLVDLMVNELSKLRAQLDECEKVVAFYGNKENWQSLQVGYGDKSQIKWHDIEDISSDDRVKEFGGKKAREYQAKYSQKLEGEE